MMIKPPLIDLCTLSSINPVMSPLITLWQVASVEILLCRLTVQNIAPTCKQS